jgi:hypothetical protein
MDEEKATPPMGHLAAYHELKQSQHNVIMQKNQEREAQILARCMQLASAAPLVTQVDDAIRSPYVVSVMKQ